jgi:hypothetical protein
MDIQSTTLVPSHERTTPILNEERVRVELRFGVPYGAHNMTVGSGAMCQAVFANAGNLDAPITVEVYRSDVPDIEARVEDRLDLIADCEQRLRSMIAEHVHEQLAGTTDALDPETMLATPRERWSMRLRTEVERIENTTGENVPALFYQATGKKRNIRPLRSVKVIATLPPKRTGEQDMLTKLVGEVVSQLGGVRAVDEEKLGAAIARGISAAASTPVSPDLVSENEALKKRIAELEAGAKKK